MMGESYLLTLVGEKSFWNAVVLVPVVYVALVALYRLYVVTRRGRLLLGKFQSLERHWLYGSMHTMKGAGPEFFRLITERAARYKYGYVSWLGYLLPALQVCHPDTMKIVFKRSDPKSVIYKQTLSEWIGEGLILKSGRKWYRNRRLLTPAFHFDILKSYLPIYNDAAEIFMEKLEKLNAGEAGFDLLRHMSLLTLDVVLRCAFSNESDCQRQPCTYIEAVAEFAELWNKLTSSSYYIIHFTFPWLYGLTPQGRRFYKLCDIVHREAQTIIHQRRQQLRQLDRETYLKERKYVDFLDIMLLATDEDGNGISKEDMHAEVETFLFAGHDTTSTGLSWALYLMATHPEIQEKVHAELDEIFEEKTNQQIEWEDLSKMTYVTQCLKETLRLYPPVPIIARELKEDVEIMGCKVVKNTYVGLHIYGLHHNVHVWGHDHMEFKPDRFSAAESKDRDAYAFVPFSAGPRNCIGQNFALTEEKVIFARLMHRYTFKLGPGCPEPEPAFRIVLRPRNDITLLAIPRH